MNSATIRQHASTTDPRRRISWPALGALAVLVVVSIAAHVWALRRSLPLQDIDEIIFVRRAVNIADTGDLNPHWFGHPGSTVIYPLAGAYRVWETVAHHGSLIGAEPQVTAHFQKYPTGFYVIGRLWAIVLSVGAIPLLFLIGRRAFNTRVALIAAAVWVVLPWPVQYGRIVRTDSAGLFFGLLSLWLCLRLLDEARLRWCVLAGLSVGLAVASRYFMVALVPCLLGAAIVSNRRASRSAMRASGIALGSALGGFVLSTPYFFLDWNTAWRSLQGENEPMLGQNRLSPLGNLRWYLGTAIPESLTWPLVALSLAGILIALWRRTPGQLLLLVFCGTFLAGICAATLHWQRWTIQILPVLVLFAASTVDTIVERITALVRRVPRASILGPVGLVAITAVLMIHPAVDLAEANRRASDPRASKLALDWIKAHVQPGDRMVIDPSTLLTRYNTQRDVDDRFSPDTDTLAGYRQAGYDYLVIRNHTVGLFLAHPKRYARAITLYQHIVCHTRLVARFPRRAPLGGVSIAIYQLDEPPSQEVSSYCASVGVL